MAARPAPAGRELTNDALILNSRCSGSVGSRRLWWDHDDADPATAIESYLEAYNSADLDAIVGLFAEDAVISGHPLDPRAEGAAEITAAHATELDRARPRRGVHLLEPRVHR